MGEAPKCILKDKIRLKSLVYNLTKRDGEKGSLVIHGLPEEAGDIRRWLGKLGIDLPYRGEGLPAISAKVLHHLIRHGKERVWLSGEDKAELLEQFNHLCAICGRSASLLEWDHVELFSESLGEQRFQPLCPECHQSKTATESRSFDCDVLASHFEKGVWEDYVESKRPPPLVWKAKDCPNVLGCEIADVRRCRKRALEFNVHRSRSFARSMSVPPEQASLSET